MAINADPEDFFLYPRVRRLDEVRYSIDRLEQLEQALAPDRRAALQEIIRLSRSISSSFFLVPELNPFEFLLLMTTIDLYEKIRKLEQHGWVHPPFP
jgi:hypothetical protein